jgi:hypothetical protein
MTDGSLVLDIALGIIVAKVLTTMLKELGRRWEARKVSRSMGAEASDFEKASAEDWLDVWDSLPESAKEQLKRIVEDDQLRRRTQELNLWPVIWLAAPEETKDKLRSRWKVAKVPPKVST